MLVAGLKAENAPYPVFIVLGTSGVGKPTPNPTWRSKIAFEFR